jgi:uncharacterized RDD family membrane protein YckC
MTATTDPRLGRLPDPGDVTEAAFYDGVNSKRLLAWIIDSILITLITVLLTPFTAFTAFLFWPFFWLTIGFVYRVLTLAMGSATWGMAITGMELRRADGAKFDLGTALMHTALYSFAVAVSPLQLISVILMLVSPRNQGLGDMILGTGAIRRSL